ncbi:RNase H domain-containing protein [Hirsutella rhossiliensis]|uniref:RNase H domain-containing protein n=1 Tax=Hirsutella rhossiliensis TaxID=111463 RepID=A0A9P8MKX7_9HYPO|nr:RNase H domain-containing protein [Hirsutella rhossiliensis]KAH0956955.1 RNase H domain-containing protein [Hirsutella rhossiliensis]
MELFRGRVRFMNIVRCTYPNDKSMLLIMTDGHALTTANQSEGSNRAELRAVIAALRFRHWPGEGFSTVIIATDSEYVVEGSTQWAKAWVQNNWRTKANSVNLDVWPMFLILFILRNAIEVFAPLWRRSDELDNVMKFPDGPFRAPVAEVLLWKASHAIDLGFEFEGLCIFVVERPAQQD